MYMLAAMTGTKSRPCTKRMGASQMAQQSWDFWIDRGGTFTDVVGRAPDGTLTAHKLLSENPEAYTRRRRAGHPRPARPEEGRADPAGRVGAVKMGTTVATNALLERKGDRTLLVTTKGFRDALRIGYQARPKIFAKQIIKPEMLYERVVEVDERVRADGTVEQRARPRRGARRSRSRAGRRHRGGRDRLHARLSLSRRTSKQVAALAREIGFAQVSVSHEVSPLIKLVGRGDTTVVDAYLSPILRRYVAQVGRAQLDAQQLRRAADVHDVVGRADRRRTVPGQGRDPLRPGRRRRRHGGDRPRGRLRAPHRLRHGRHLDRRVAFRRRVRARLRDRGRGRAHARADDADPHGRGRRRLDPAFRRRALPRRAGLGRRQSGTEVLPPRRAARRHRRQRDGRQADPGFLPEDLRPEQDQPLDADAVRAAFAELAKEVGEQVAGGDRRRLHPDRGREHGECDQEDFGAARLRRDALCAQLLRRRRRPACLPRRRRARHDDGADPSVLVAALGLRHGPRRHPRDAPAGDRGAVRRQGARHARTRSAARSRKTSSGEVAGQGVPAKDITVHVRAHIRYAGTDTALVVEGRHARRR